MRNSQRPCHLIQEDIACGRELSQEDSQHILSCSSCSDVAAKFAELDSLVRNVVEQEIPIDFADRVVAKIWQEESKGRNLFSQWLPLLERMCYSRAAQWVLVAIGSVFGLFKIFRFFSAVLVHGFI
jgi:hypothetical protein